jgi:RND superfamily putative drug exporter
MSRYLYALGAFSHRRRWWVLGAWLAVLIAVAAAGLGLGGEPTDDFSIPGTESQRAVEELSQKLPAFGGAQTQITFATTGDAKITDPAPAAAVDAAVGKLSAVPDVAVAAGPAQTRQIAPDGRVGLGTVQWKVPPGDVDEAALDAVESAVAPAREAGLLSRPHNISGTCFRSLP